MRGEGSEFDKKSLRVLTKPQPDWDALACDCVAYANARGGSLHIGIEDEEDVPPPGQKVDDALIEAMRKRLPIGEIHARIGTEIPRRDLQRQLGRLASGGDIGKTGKRRWTRYLWTK